MCAALVDLRIVQPLRLQAHMHASGEDPCPRTEVYGARACLDPSWWTEEGWGGLPGPLMPPGALVSNITSIRYRGARQLTQTDCLAASCCLPAVRSRRGSQFAPNLYAIRHLLVDSMPCRACPCDAGRAAVGPSLQLSATRRKAQVPVRGCCQVAVACTIFWPYGAVRSTEPYDTAAREPGCRLWPRDVPSSPRRGGASAPGVPDTRAKVCCARWAHLQVVDAV